jgi:AcrR family transcriptional regulator
MTDASTREQIVSAADELFYRQGYQHTSFAELAEAVGISRGNFYHHFKSKDDLLEAVIAARLQSREAMLGRWELAGKTPQARIRSFIQILIANRALIKRYGCPVGTLCAELGKLGHPAQAEANRIFTLYRTWLRAQFAAAGRAAQADALAMHLLARSQGVAALASAFHDEAFIRQEVGQLEAWLATVLKDAPRGRTRRGA